MQEATARSDSSFVMGLFFIGSLFLIRQYYYMIFLFHNITFYFINNTNVIIFYFITLYVITFVKKLIMTATIKAKQITINIPVSQELKKKLTKEADKLGLSLASYCRIKLIK